MPGDVFQIRAPYLHFGGDDWPELQLLEDTPQVLLRDAIAIVGSVVEVVDAQLDRPLHHVPLFCRAAPHHEPRVPTAAKADFRDSQLGIPYLPIFHGRASSSLDHTPLTFLPL